MNYLKDWNRDNGLAGWGWRAVGLGLIALVAMAGAAWAQGGLRRKLRSLRGIQRILPGCLTQWRMSPLSRPCRSFRLQRLCLLIRCRKSICAIRLKLVDYKDKEHAGTYELWKSEDGLRIEIHTDTYNWSALTKGGQRWAIEDGQAPMEGLRPLRVKEFIENRLMSHSVSVNASRDDPAFVRGSVDGVTSLCGGDHLKAMICFEEATGLPDLTMRNDEMVVYRDWRQVGPWHMAGQVSMKNGKHLLFEVKLTEASAEVSPDAFSVPAGATEVPAETLIGEQDISVTRKGPHPIKKRGSVRLMMQTNTGSAQVKVWVNEKGNVTKAEVEDSDNKDIASQAKDVALSTVYEPYIENGIPASFETVYSYSIVPEKIVPQGMKSTIPGIHY